MKKSIKGILLFVLLNGLIIIAFFYAPQKPVIFISILFLLLFNYVFFLLFSAKADNDLTKIETKVNTKEVSNAVHILRYAACALSFISFITTAEGLHKFVFTQVWQAYLASFAVQSILLIFNFLFFHFYVKINSIKQFPQFLKRLVTFFVVLLFTLSLVVFHRKQHIRFNAVKE